MSYFNESQFPVIASVTLAAATLMAPAVGQAQSNLIPRGQMERYCQGEASGELGVRPTYLKTEKPERQSDHYIVRGEYSDDDENVSFKCFFSTEGEFRKVNVTRHEKSGDNYDDIPEAASRRCTDRFGTGAEIRTVSALKPGYWEVIMDYKYGSRSVACTVQSDGRIENWIELD